MPEGVRLVPIDYRTGEPSVLGRPGTILEAFQPGTEPTRSGDQRGSGLSFGQGAVSGDDVDDDDDDRDDEEDDLGGLY